MALLCNDVSHWLGANLESALQTIFDEYGWYWPVTIPTQTIMQHEYIILHIDGLVQDCSISSANALEILQSCNKLFTCAFHFSARLNITTQMCEDLLNIWCHLTCMWIPIIKMRGSYDHLIFIMEMPLLGFFILKSWSGQLWNPIRSMHQITIIA